MFGRPGEPHLGHRQPVRRTVTSEQPAGGASGLVPLWPDHHVPVVGGLHQLIDGAAQGPGDRRQLVQGNAAMPGLDAAERGRAQEAPGGQLVQGPALGRPGARGCGGGRARRVLRLASLARVYVIGASRTYSSGMTSHDHAFHQAPRQQDASPPRPRAAERVGRDAGLRRRALIAPFLQQTRDWITELRAGAPTDLIVDLGCGNGTATVALAQQFPAAIVTAVDGSAEMLQHTVNRAAALGLGDRVVPVQADIDTTWPAIEPADVIWSALALHHFGNPDQVLASAYASTAAGGLLVAVEMDAQLRFLPPELGDGLEERWHKALSHEFQTAVPHLQTDWGSRMQQAGFDLVGQRRFEIDVKPADSELVGRYAFRTLQGVRRSVEGRLDAADLTLLDELLDPESADGVLRRADLRIRGSRTAWIGRH